MYPRNIIQYKSSGVANIFVPTIIINGRHIGGNGDLGGIGGSNSYDSAHQEYSATPSITQQQQRMAQQNSLNEHNGDVFKSVINNLRNNNSNLLSNPDEPLANDNATQYASTTATTTTSGSTATTSNGATATTSNGATTSGATATTGGLATNTNNNNSNAASRAYSGIGTPYSRRNNTNSTPIAVNENNGFAEFSNLEDTNFLDKSILFCDTFCGKKADGTQRDCVKPCMKCDGCKGKPEYIPSSPEPPSMSDIECHKLSQNSCNLNSKCFYCISTSKNENNDCTAHPTFGSIGLCETKNTSACLPISGEEGSYKVDFDGPKNNDNMTNYYGTSSKYYNVSSNMSGNPGNKFTTYLEHPNTCKGKLDPVLTYEEMRQAMNGN